jgi:hypothetical protein
MSELPSELPILCRGRPGVDTPIDTLDALGVAFRTDAERLPLLASPSCFAVIPTYLLALEPAVMATPALARVLVPSVVFGFVSSPSIRRVTTRGRPGVTTEGREAEGVARPEGVVRPCRENEAWDEARERWDATDAGRDTPAVGADSLAAWTKIPRFCAQVKY